MIQTNHTPTPDKEPTKNHIPPMLDKDHKNSSKSNIGA